MWQLEMEERIYEMPRRSAPRRKLNGAAQYITAARSAAAKKIINPLNIRRGAKRRGGKSLINKIIVHNYFFLASPGWTELVGLIT